MSPQDEIHIHDIECEGCKVHLGVVEMWSGEAPAAWCPTCWRDNKLPSKGRRHRKGSKGKQDREP